jgi:hypothetical protein
VRLLADGSSNDEIGLALGVTTKTIESALGRIFMRTSTRSRTELAVRAVREGWLDAPNPRGCLDLIRTGGLASGRPSAHVRLQHGQHRPTTIVEGGE